MPRFLPKRAYDENVHLIEALGAFRAVTRLSVGKGGLVEQTWKIEAFSAVHVTASSTHSGVSSYRYVNTQSPEIYDEGMRWEFERKLQNSKTEIDEEETLATDAVRHGQLETKVRASAVSKIKGRPFEYETDEQQLDWR